MTSDPDATRDALEQLYEDALDIYERARREVTIERADGRTQKYAATRYKQAIDRGHDEGLLLTTVANILRRPTVGFGHLEAARRPDLMLETLVLDETKPYHNLFSPRTIDLARERMAEYYREFGDS